MARWTAAVSAVNPATKHRACRISTGMVTVVPRTSCVEGALIVSPRGSLRR